MFSYENYPKWICLVCGEKLGEAAGVFSTYHHGKPDDPHDSCGWCGSKESLTQPRDYGYPGQNTKSARGKFKIVHSVKEFPQDDDWEVEKAKKEYRED